MIKKKAIFIYIRINFMPGYFGWVASILAAFPRWMAMLSNKKEDERGSPVTNFKL